MIVDDFHVFRTRIGPSKYDPPLIIDADRVLAHQIALEPFKAVTGRRVQGLVISEDSRPGRSVALIGLSP